MALAVLRLQRVHDDSALFAADLGRNRWYTWAVGAEAGESTHGMRLLTDVVHASPLLGPLPESVRGRTTIAVPLDLLDRDHRAVQLLSYRTASRDGPAVSDIVTVPLSARAGVDRLPSIVFGLGASPMDSSSAMSVHPRMTDATPVAFAYRARSLALHDASAAAHLQRRIGAVLAATTTPPEADRSAAMAAPLLAALPALMPLLQQVLTPETVQSIVRAVSPSEVIGAVTEGITQVGRLAADISRQEDEHLRALNPGVNDPALDQLLAGLSVSRGLGVTRRGPAHRARAMKQGTGHGTSQARSLMKSPRRASPVAEPVYRRTTQVTLDFADVAPVQLDGRTRICYRQGQPWQLPLTVNTARPIRDARAIVIVKSADAKRVLLRSRTTVAEVSADRLAVVPSFTVAETGTLVAGREYVVTAHLLWRTKQRATIGTSITQLVTVAGPLLFGRTGEGGVMIPLNDATRHRDYWHKVWQGSFDRDIRRVDFDVKYYVALEPDRRTHGRMETEMRTAREGKWTERGRLQSGMQYAPEGLNALLGQLPGAASLAADELEALTAPAFVAHVNQAARFKATLRGRDGTSGAIWVFPEVRLTTLHLHRAADVNGNGQVTGFVPHEVQFPVPALLHVIGARTTR